MPRGRAGAWLNGSLASDVNAATAYV